MKSMAWIGFVMVISVVSLASTAAAGSPNILTWPRMKVDEFGCYLEKTFGVKDKTFNCELQGYVNHGDPCQHTDTYYEGPAFPDDQAERIHSLVKSVELSWEHGELQGVSVHFKNRLTRAEIITLFHLPDSFSYPDEYQNVMSIDIQESCGNCLIIQGFEHIGAGEVDCGQQAAQDFTRQAQSSVFFHPGVSGEMVLKIVNTGFESTALSCSKEDRASGAACGMILLEYTLERLSQTTGAWGTSRLTLSAWGSQEKIFDRQIWRITEEAEEGRLTIVKGIGDEVYETIRRGCCDQEDLHTFFDLHTGAKIMTFSGNLAFVEIEKPNHYTRLLGYHSQRVPQAFEVVDDVQTVFAQFEDAIGVLTLASGREILQRIVMRGDFPTWTPTILLKSAKHPNATESLDLFDSKAYQVVLEFNDGTEVIIPVDHDRFDLEHAVHPATMILEQMK